MPDEAAASPKPPRKAPAQRPAAAGAAPARDAVQLRAAEEEELKAALSLVARSGYAVVQQPAGGGGGAATAAAGPSLTPKENELLQRAVEAEKELQKLKEAETKRREMELRLERVAAGGRVEGGHGRRRRRQLRRGGGRALCAGQGCFQLLCTPQPACQHAQQLLPQRAAGGGERGV